MTTHQTLIGPMRVAPHAPIPTGTLDRQEAIRERWGYPWTNIPRLYRRWGLPVPAITDGANASLRRQSPLNRVLTICGPVGTGKTTNAALVATCIATREWTGPRPSEHGIGYLLCMDLGWMDRDLMPGLIAYPTLIMDDLSGNITQAGLVNAQMLVEQRIAHKRRTIVTTTMEMPRDLATREMELNAGRELGLASRLAGGAVVTLTGDDRRLTLGDDAKSRAMADP